MATDLERGGAAGRTSPTYSSNAVTPTTSTNALGAKHELDSSPDHIYDASKPLPPHHRLDWKRRMAHHTFVYFAMTMSAAGVANAIFAIPLSFKGQWEIGLIFFFLSLLLFVVNIAGMATRFICYPQTFVTAFTSPGESLFIPASIVSLGLNIQNISTYGGAAVKAEWFNSMTTVLFWIYCILAIISSLVIYLVIWETQARTIESATPVWVFPSYPLLIVGGMAASMSTQAVKNGDTTQALAMIFVGTTIQSTGLFIAILIYAAYMHRLLTAKLPQEALRPQIFVSVGPAAFSAGAYIKLAAATQTIFPADYFGNGLEASLILRVVANFFGIGLWGLAFWFFLVSVGAHWTLIKKHDSRFDVGFFAWVFPQSALCTATGVIGTTYAIRPLQIFSIALTILLTLTYLLLLVFFVRALLRKRLLWPGWEEDRSQGDFHAKPIPLE